jgi:hypothetical protein
MPPSSALMMEMFLHTALTAQKTNIDIFTAVRTLEVR